MYEKIYCGMHYVLGVKFYDVVSRELRRTSIDSIENGTMQNIGMQRVFPFLVFHSCAFANIFSILRLMAWHGMNMCCI